LDRYDWKLHPIKATRHWIAILFREAGQLFLGDTKKARAFYEVPRGTFLCEARQ